MKLYKTASIIFAIIFAMVGVVFLSIPGSVIRFFNQLSAEFGFPAMPILGIGFYNILAVGYMYIVTLLAILAARHPENSLPPILLINAKGCSSILSLGLFIIYKPYLLFLANCLVDGSIAIIVAIIYIRMKNGSLNPRLALSSLYIPNRIKNRKLAELFDITAKAFSRESPILEDLSYKESLYHYALFTKSAAEEAIRNKSNLEYIKKALYDGAYRIGETLRKEFGVRDGNGVMASCRILYKAIGIDFRGDPDGKVIINRCFFSRYYSSDICEIISSIDCGLVAGLSNGDQLYFRQRMTDSHDCCRARLTKAELSP
jgi:hypothetical protein